MTHSLELPILEEDTTFFKNNLLSQRISNYFISLAEYSKGQLVVVSLVIIIVMHHKEFTNKGLTASSSPHTYKLSYYCYSMEKSFLTSSISNDTVSKKLVWMHYWMVSQNCYWQIIALFGIFSLGMQSDYWDMADVSQSNL